MVHVINVLVTSPSPENQKPNKYSINVENYVTETCITWEDGDKHVLLHFFLKATRPEDANEPLLTLTYYSHFLLDYWERVKCFVLLAYRYILFVRPSFKVTATHMITFR